MFAESMRDGHHIDDVGTPSEDHGEEDEEVIPPVSGAGDVAREQAEGHGEGREDDEGSASADDCV